jgi:UDP-N-acetylglucosamine/UDP-N-acetylgalactosamine 4-epimerase
VRLSGKKILVTGGAGFIGSNLCEYFLESNQVVCLDNLSTGNESNLANFRNHPNFTFIQGDIRDLEACKIAAKGCDVILHQAALGSVPRSIADPISTNDNNINGFLNVLQAAREENVKRIVYAGSSSTYGDHPDLPKVEDKIGKQLSPYAITKYVNELYAGVYHKIFGMEIIGLRYFNVFGKNQNPDGAYAAAIPKFIRAFLRGEKLTVFGDGTQSRDFTYIKNVIQVNEKAVLCNNPAALGESFNVAYGQATTLNELLEVLAELIGDRHELLKLVTYTEKRLGDVEHSLADISKAQNMLDYAPTHDLKAGLSEAIQWYKESLKSTT